MARTERVVAHSNVGKVKDENAFDDNHGYGFNSVGHAFHVLVFSGIVTRNLDDESLGEATVVSSIYLHCFPVEKIT